MRAATSLVLAPLLCLTFSTVAHAECAMIRAFVAPVGQERLPPHPRLHLFWPRRISSQAPKVAIHDGAGRPVTFTLTRVSWTPSYEVHVLKVTAAAGTQLSVVAGTGDSAARATYQIDGSWTKPSPAAWKVDAENSSYGWACSFERASILRIPHRASSYRVDWRPAGADTAVQSVIVPAQHSWFFVTKGPATGGSDELKLGHANCMGWNFRWDDDAVIVRVVGLHPDGSEDPPSPEVRLEAPPRTQGRGIPDTPDALVSPQGAWDSLVSALSSGRILAVRRVCTPRGWDELRQSHGTDPARLEELGIAWGSAPVRWLPNQEHRAEGRWGPEVKEHSFRFVEDGGMWRLDGHSPGE